MPMPAPVLGIRSDKYGSVCFGAGSLHYWLYSYESWNPSSSSGGLSASLMDFYPFGRLPCGPAALLLFAACLPSLCGTRNLFPARFVGWIGLVAAALVQFYYATTDTRILFIVFFPQLPLSLAFIYTRYIFQLAPLDCACLLPLPAFFSLTLFISLFAALSANL